MSGKPIDNATTTISLKRKRAPVWPFTTRPVLEKAVATPCREGNCPGTLATRRVENPSLNRGSRIRLSSRASCIGINENDQWIVLKIRQHSQDPTRTNARTGLEGSQVSNLNNDLAQLLRSIVRGGGRSKVTISAATCKADGITETRNLYHKPSCSYDGNQVFDTEKREGYAAESSPPTSADRSEEE